MRIEIAYTIVAERHPEILAYCVADIRRGKSKMKDTHPSTWRWYYSWATQIDETTLTAGSVEDRLPEGFVPREVHAEIRTYYAAQAEAEQRDAAMSPKNGSARWIGLSRNSRATRTSSSFR